MNTDELAASPPARLPFPVTRAAASPVETRADDDSAMPVMTGHFSTFNDWYEVDSMFEGHYLERIAPGAFRKTIRESRDAMKVLFNHGHDASIGDQVLGSIADLHEDDTGPAYAVPLFEGVPPLIVSGLRAKAYGSSFRFTVEKDVWDHSPERSDHNADGLPERTITEARVFEFGPVTFPANPNATAGVRSTTDAFYRRSRDPEQFETLLRSAQVARTPADAGAASPSDEPPVDTQESEPSQPDTQETDGAAAEHSTVPAPVTKRFRTREDYLAWLSRV